MRDIAWNGWRLRGRVLRYRPFPDRAYVYAIDLDHFGASAARLLDIIIQVTSKTWASDACVAGLIRALDYSLQPHAMLCRSEKVGRSA